MPLAVPVPALAARLAGLRLPHADSEANVNADDAPARPTPPRSVVLLYQLPAAVWARILTFLPDVTDLIAAAHALPILHQSPPLAHCWSAALGHALATPDYAARLALSALGGGGGRALDTPLLSVPLRAVAVHADAHLVVLAPVGSDADSDTEPTASSTTSAVVSATVTPSPCHHGPNSSDPRAAVLALDLVQTSVWWSLRMTLACMNPDARVPDAAHAHRVFGLYAHRAVLADPIYGPAVGGTRGECVYRATVAETVTRTHRVLDVDLAPMVVSFAHLARFFTDVSVPDPSGVSTARSHLATAGSNGEWTAIRIPDGTVATYCAICFPSHTAPVLCAALAGSAVPSPAATPNRWMRPLAKLKSAPGIVEPTVPVPRAPSPPCQRVRARPLSVVEPGKSAAATTATWSMGGVLAAAAATRRLVVGGWRRLTDSDSASLHEASHF
ncbi:hypothetical protein AMAG_13541 [Allomyces macrogynus ATCC 38327]|uniref:Uncharacterized protein n=1 Tax=Allomyces macrogynus (strain ATCC 38327) TaxID=578462 RepID=A0A0L0T217_ALLM3|nr:hypothetical protein AMAG_13541 [Allomyces macrogynus ATCC 38327]|eukprot:KNE68903.1 hypothetical protein AMAG_13541 [Allomyces macrogynus ATCC 38327]